jgi:peptide/nickel transport system substrate-binding protein/oligopeptide transport system substrate-binding protein
MNRGHASVGFVLAFVLVGVLIAIAGCGGGDESTTTSAAGEQPVAGGTVSVYINEPVAIDPVDLEESEGTQVGQALFDSLATFDYLTMEVGPAAAESWDVNADATVWTFHLVKGAKFHDGTPVTAADFVFAWNRLCNPENKSNVSYHLSAVKGYDEVQAGTATELSGLKAVDENTLEVTLSYSFADFEYVVAHPTLAPVPKAAVEKDPKAYSEAPVGNGPFMMVGSWQHDQSIQVKAFADYYGTKPNIEGVDFKIFKDPETAFLEFKAGNLDWTQIPSGQVQATETDFGVSDDGYTGNPGKQVMLGSELSVYYLVLNTRDDVLKNLDLRKAISLAINRQAIADTVYEGVRAPASSIIPPGIVGYEANAFPYSKYDVAAAKEALKAAGYPDGQGLPEIVLSCNSGGGHEEVMALVQADLKAVGINVKTDFTEWAAYLKKLDDGTFQIGRLGWFADYPIIDNFIYPIFFSSSGDNKSKFNDKAVDDGISAARKITDETARVAAYQAVVKTVGEAVPVVPIVAYKHHHVTSDRVYNLVYSPNGLLDFQSCYVKAAE